jgi:hypothetical protein
MRLVNTPSAAIGMIVANTTQGGAKKKFVSPIHTLMAGRGTSHSTEAQAPCLALSPSRNVQHDTKFPTRSFLCGLVLPLGAISDDRFFGSSNIQIHPGKLVQDVVLYTVGFVKGHG